MSVPVLDIADNGYPTDNVTTLEDYFDTDSDFPLAEFCARIDDNNLQHMLDIFNKIYDTTFILKGIRDRTPTGDCLKIYNIIKEIPKYKRLLYNYGLPLINLSILKNKFDKINLKNPLMLQSVYPVHNDLYDFTHTAIEKLFSIMVQEGRTYNEMSLQMFGSSHDDGLDVENKLSRLITFWSKVFGRTKDDKLMFYSLYQDYSNQPPLFTPPSFISVPTPFFMKRKMYTSIDGSLLGRTISAIPPFFPPSPPYVDEFMPFITYYDIIKYFKEFTMPHDHISSTNASNSVRKNATEIEIIDFLKSLFPGYYDSFTNESSLSINPYSVMPVFATPEVNPVIFRNCYSLNFTFAYGNFCGSCPTRAVTYGDYLLLLIYFLKPEAVTNYIISLPISDLFTYNDLATIVDIFEQYVCPSDLLPSMNGYDCNTLFGVTLPSVFNKTVNNIFSRIVLFGYDEVFLSHLIELFNYIPMSSNISFGTAGPIIIANLHNVKNFYNIDAIIEFFTSGNIKHKLFRNNDSNLSSFFDGNIQTNKINQVIALTIFSLLAQEYSNSEIDIFNNKEYAINFESLYFPFYSPQYYTLSGNLLRIVKATCILMDRTYCYFIKLFETNTIITYDEKFTENTTDVSMIHTLLNIPPVICEPKSDPIDYMSFINFSFLINYNSEFAEQMSEYLVYNFLFDMNTNLDPDLQARLNNMERRMNYSAGKSNTISAFNNFNSYRHSLI
jgi:hypothetical protein